MSAARAVPLRSPSAPKRAESAASRVLRLVPQGRSRAAKTPFAVVLVVVLGGGLLGLLLLNTLVAQGSFRLHDLAKQSRQLEQRQQQLEGQVEAVQAPEQLAATAVRLGMVPGGAPAFLRVSDGKVLGQPTPGRALPVAPAPAATAATTTAATTTARTSQAAGRSRAAAPTGSTTWTAPRQSPPPSTGAHR